MTLFTFSYMHCWSNNNGTVFMLDHGRTKRQPVLDLDVCVAVRNMLQLSESKGQIYELGGSHEYSLKELFEFLSNVMSHRPRYINYSYEDFMKLHLSPNWNFEKVINWLISRPDYLAELRTDILAKKRDGVKTFEDLHISPVATHQILTDLGQWIVERQNVEKEDRRDHDENYLDDDGHM